MAFDEPAHADIAQYSITDLGPTNTEGNPVSFSKSSNEVAFVYGDWDAGTFIRPDVSIDYTGVNSNGVLMGTKAGPNPVASMMPGTQPSNSSATLAYEEAPESYTNQELIYAQQYSNGDYDYREIPEDIDDSGDVVGRVQWEQYTTPRTITGAGFFVDSAGDVTLTPADIEAISGVNAGWEIEVDNTLDANFNLGEVLLDRSNGTSVATDLLVSNGADPAASTLASDGTVVGYRYVPGQTDDTEAVIRLADGTETALSPPTGDGYLVMTGVNASHYAVGNGEVSANDSFQALVWAPGSTTPVTLNSLVPADSGWVFTHVVAINDNNDILAYGTYNGTPEAALLTHPTTRTTSTTVACSPTSEVVGEPTSCTATVKDTDPSPVTTPTGSVGFTTSGAGTFKSNNSCKLTATKGVGTASCVLSYAPGAAGSGHQTISAHYSGDGVHGVSSGSSTLTVLAKPTITFTSTKLKDSADKVKVPLRCTGSVCAGKLTLTSSSGKALGSASYKIAAGKSAETSLKLNSTGKKLVKQANGKSLSVKAIATVTHGKTVTKPCSLK